MKEKKLSVWKYEVPFFGPTQLEIPFAGDILSVQYQNEVPCIWVQVDPEGIKYKREFTWVPTGQPFPEYWTYVGTLQEGIYVWHLYTYAAKG